MHLAVAMGAKVIAAGRNEETLAGIAARYAHTGRIATVRLTGGADADAAALLDANGGRGADSYIDWSPSGVQNPAHIGPCIRALRAEGRVCFIGGVFGNVEIPYFRLISHNIQIGGRYMFRREHLLQVIKMAETGLLTFGEKEGTGVVVKKGYKLADIEKVFDDAFAAHGYDTMVVVEP